MQFVFTQTIFRNPEMIIFTSISVNNMPDRIDDLIYRTLAEKEEINFLIQCRKATEGVLRTLVIQKGLPHGEDYLSLGEVMRDEQLLEKLSVDINIKANINYVRLYGNRAAHYNDYSISTQEVVFVKSAFVEIVLFYYKSVNNSIPKATLALFNKNFVLDKKHHHHSYNYDTNLYIESLLAIENSEDDYPKKGNILLANICSKIIIDLKGVIPDFLYYYTGKQKNIKRLNIEKAIRYIDKTNRIDKIIVENLIAVNSFLKNSSTIIRHHKQIPEVPNDIRQTLINITDWYYGFKQFTKAKNNTNFFPFLIDLFTVLMLIISILIGIYHTPVIPPLYRTIPAVTVMFGLLLFFFAYSYLLAYSVIPSSRNRKLFNIARFISSYSGFVGIVLLIYITYQILNDGKPDAPFTDFFLSVSIWAASLQISIFINSIRGTQSDKILRVLSVIFFVLIILIIIFFYSLYFMID